MPGRAPASLFPPGLPASRAPSAPSSRRHVWTVLVSLATVPAIVDVAASGKQEDRPDLRHFKSHSVAITDHSLSTVTNILPPPSERVASDVLARIGLVLSNRSDRAFWLVVRLTPPPPNPTCPSGIAYLEPKEQVEFRCTQETLLADVDYPIDIVVFSDSALTDTLEQSATRLRFDRGTVRWMEERLAFLRHELEADQLPPSDEPITLKERLGVSVGLAMSGGVVIPSGDFSNGFGTGGMGATSFGLTGQRFGARLLIGSTEPGARAPTNDAYSARLGRRVEVMQAIMPFELQGVAAFPAQTSRLAVALQAGAGLQVVTVRLKNTDDRLDHDHRFGFSAGAGLRYGVTSPDRTHTVSTGLNGVFHGSGSSRYTTVELELVFLIW